MFGTRTERQEEQRDLMQKLVAEHGPVESAVCAAYAKG